MTPLRDIHDGVSKTLMMGEIKVVLPNGPGWGGPLSDFTTALGGQTFQTWLPPNSVVPDEVARLRANRRFYLGNGIPIPTAAPHSYEQTFAARSHHTGGVNAVRCDGSVSFYQDDIDLLIWRAVSTANGREIGLDPEE